MDIDTIKNPFQDSLQAQFWEICVRRDLEAFLASDWSITAGDFCDSEFLGIDANGSLDPLDWLPSYPTLEAYRREFDAQAAEFGQKTFVGDIRKQLYSLLTMSNPRIEGDRALVTKIFDGEIQESNGMVTPMRWQSVFHFKQADSRWLITGFVGYLPLTPGNL